MNRTAWNGCAMVAVTASFRIATIGSILPTASISRDETRNSRSTPSDDIDTRIRLLPGPPTVEGGRDHKVASSNAARRWDTNSAGSIVLNVPSGSPPSADDG